MIRRRVTDLWISALLLRVCERQEAAPIGRGAAYDAAVDAAFAKYPRFGAEIKEWSQKFDRDHDWHLRRIEEEKESAHEKHRKEMAGVVRDLEIARHDGDSLRARLTHALDHLSELVDRHGKAEEEMDVLRHKLGNTEKLLAEEKEKCDKLRGMVRRQRKPVAKQS